MPETIPQKNFQKKFPNKMADGANIYELRSWMYSHKDSEE